jgi:hypothetical protein
MHLFYTSHENFGEKMGGSDRIYGACNLWKETNGTLKNSETDIPLIEHLNLYGVTL